MLLRVLTALIHEARVLLEARPQSAAVAVEQDGKILLLKRGSTAPWMPGKWNLPGGGVDSGETPEKAARREAAEEASIRVGKMQLLTKANLGKEVGDVFFFHSTDFSGKPKINWESSALKWVPKADAPGYPLVPGIKPALLKLLSLGEKGTTKADKKAAAQAKAAKTKAKKKAFPWRRETIHGMKVVFKSGVSPAREKKSVDQLLHAYEILKGKRFKDAWGGTLFIDPEAKGTIRGDYMRTKDTTRIFGRVSKTTVIHELGHRWWYRNMDRPARLQFIAWVKSGLSPVSAYAKKDAWEAFAEAFKYFMLGMAMTPQQVDTFKLVARGGRFEDRVQERGSEPKVAIFDFDGTLFKSPPRPPWYDKKAWWHDPTSLYPPCVPEKPGSEWWNGPLVQLAKQRISDPNTHTVLLTGRQSGPFNKRVRELLKHAGLNFDEVLLNPGTATLPFKAGVLNKLPDKTAAKFVELWDDHPRYTRKFQSLFDKRGIKFSIKNTKTLSHPAVCKAPEEG